jgi:hypothetical protein
MQLKILPKMSKIKRFQFLTDLVVAQWCILLEMFKDWTLKDFSVLFFCPHHLWASELRSCILFRQVSIIPYYIVAGG